MILDPATSSGELVTAAPAATGDLFVSRLTEVLGHLETLAAKSGPTKRRVHGLRVATRRAEAALAGFASVIDEKAARKIRRALKQLRRSAARARDADVALPTLEEQARQAAAKQRDAAAKLLSGAKTERREAYADVARMAKGFPRRRFEKLVRRLVERSALMALEPRVAARQSVHDAVAQVRQQAEAGLTSDEHLHRLRLRVKRLRYVIELFDGLLRGEAVDTAVARLRELSDALGAVSDGMALRARLESQKQRAGLAGLLAAQARQQAHARRHGQAVWRRLERDAVLDGLQQATLGTPKATACPPIPPASAPERITPASGDAPTRIAAIDVGTNSIRLIVAEAGPDGAYRVLDDEKEVARLGRGLDRTGRIDERAMEQAAFAVARMKRIAEGYGVRAVRAVATCAAREAANGDELLRLVRRWAGLEVRVISAREEALLAFESVSRAFDLRAFDAAVVDIGGGSTQVTVAKGGVAERVFALPIGAVRLTERFGGPVECAGPRWREMTKWLRGLLEREMPPPALADGPEPRLMIGTGGTMTALGNMALAAEVARRGGGRGTLGAAPPVGALQGFEIKVGLLKDLARDLRRMSVEERARVPGLSADRADIIIAGLAIVLAVVRRLGVRRIRVHDGGIRDGLLLNLVRELHPAAGGAPRAGADPLHTVRRFAQSCRVDQAHAEHVARLAVRMHEQLAPSAASAYRATWANAESRRLLHAASWLLDVGYVINYDKHHLHSFHLIMHGVLPGYTPRQIAILAHVARYHRGVNPKADHDSFAALPKADQETVRRLAAIVRLAVGLDRTHVQGVRDVRVVGGKDSTRFVVEADENPAVDLWGASRKSALFNEVFGTRAEFHWQLPAPASPGHINGVTPVVVRGARRRDRRPVEATLH